MNKHDKQGISYEANIRYLVEKSNKRAWTIATVATLFSLLMLGLLYYILPLKETIPYVIKVDKATGETSIITALTSKKYTYNEAIDKHFTSDYVKKREAYYYELIAQDYRYIQVLSAPRVSEAYRALYLGKNARDKRLKNDIEVHSKILSVVLNNSNGTKTATIRVQLKQIDKHSNRLIQQSIRVITMAYDYYPTLKMSESERLQNPLGFKVLTYRKDREVIQDEDTTL